MESEATQVALRNIRQALQLLRTANSAIQRKKYNAAADAVSNATSKLSFVADLIAHQPEHN